MRDRSDDPSRHERTFLPRSYISFPSGYKSKTKTFYFSGTEKLRERYNKRIAFTVTILKNKVSSVLPSLLLIGQVQNLFITPRVCIYIYIYR